MLKTGVKKRINTIINMAEIIENNDFLVIIFIPAPRVLLQSASILLKIYPKAMLI